MVQNTKRLSFISMSATLQSEPSHIWEGVHLPRERNPSRVTGVIHAAVARTITAALPDSHEPRRLSAWQTAVLMIESIQKPDTEGHEMFCRVENEPPHFIKERRQATCSNHPSAVEHVVCAGKISATLSSISHICTNLLFPGIGCCNLAFCCAKSIPGRTLPKVSFNN